MTPQALALRAAARRRSNPLAGMRDGQTLSPACREMASAPAGPRRDTNRPPCHCEGRRPEAIPQPEYAMGKPLRQPARRWLRFPSTARPFGALRSGALAMTRTMCLSLRGLNVSEARSNPLAEARDGPPPFARQPGDGFGPLRGPAMTQTARPSFRGPSVSEARSNPLAGLRKGSAPSPSCQETTSLRSL